MRSCFMRLSLLLLLLPMTLLAENSTHTGGYTIHHNALTTDNLPPKVASAYNIPRSTTRGMLNVSVMKNQPGSRMGTAVTAQVRVIARNLYGQMREISLREIKEDNAIYYIGDFPVSHREILQFKLEIIPEGRRYPLHAHLRQEFFTK